MSREINLSKKKVAAEEAGKIFDSLFQDYIAAGVDQQDAIIWATEEAESVFNSILEKKES